MKNSDIKIAKKETKETRRNPKIVGKYVTVEEAIEAKEAELRKVIPELDLSVLLQQIRQ